MPRILGCIALLAACQSDGGPKHTTTEEQVYIPNVSPDPRTTTPNHNAPMKPLIEGFIGGPSGTTGTAISGQYVDGAPRTCWSDADCRGTFTHCVKDTPSEVGLCTRECSSSQDCTNNGMWLCDAGNWSDTETRQMCILTCVLNNECPTGTSCNDGYCGTPCSGNNCQALSCDSHQSYDCVGDAVYWFNGCGDIEDVKETCGGGTSCVFGQCLGGGVTGPTAPTGVSPGSPECGGGHVYRCGSSSTVLEVDSCGDVIGQESCSGGKECSGGMCRCMPSSQTKCIGGKKWQVDSCGAPRSVVGSC